MPNVGGVQYPYTPEGIAAAQQAQRPIQKTGPGDFAQNAFSNIAFGPLTAPGLGERLGQQPTFQSHRPEQPTFRDVSHRPRSGQDWLRDQLAGIRQNWQTDEFGNVVMNQFGAPATQPSNFNQLIGRSLSGVPQRQATPQPTFASVSHRPQQGGNRAIGKQGPTFAPTSLNYNAISPANRIAGNIAAVMSGRPGPSPGTNPHLSQSGRISNPPGYQPNPYGPTGQLRPPRQPIQKRG